MTVKRKAVEITVISAISVFLFCAFARMFYFQAMGNSDYFFSDLAIHIEFAKTGRGYSLLYSLMGVLLVIFKSNISIAVMGSLMVLGTWFATAKLISHPAKCRYFTALIIALPILIVTGIYIPFIYERYYWQQLVTQPYHNITYFAMRLFAVLAMLAFFKIFDGYIQNIKARHWVALALLLAASTSVKPSFLYGFALALLIFLIIDFFKCGFKAKPFWQIIIMGLVVIPSLLIMLWQYVILYGGGATGESSSSIALIWGANFFKAGVLNTCLKLICSLAFPVLVAIKNRKELSRFEKFSYLMFLIQWVIATVFAESGPRASHGNFFWGVYIGAYFMFVAATARFARNIVQVRKVTPYTVAGGLLLFGHIASSVAYFVIMMCGGNFAQ